ncbi:uncharacterized protein LOC129315330 isoform X2 [Prosopis cineraria]|uniref:uncharacterized protein LOC129315330 isoform X2 n=1 Tax=Prosopis cineraria TaxID=364024 RepID=UPI00241069AD|nr:uncharacterized protein LOC129315330 isoform X2 [Prosopis cineraria]
MFFRPACAIQKARMDSLTKLNSPSGILLNTRLWSQDHDKQHSVEGDCESPLNLDTPLEFKQITSAFAVHQCVDGRAAASNPFPLPIYREQEILRDVVNWMKMLLSGHTMRGISEDLAYKMIVELFATIVSNAESAKGFSAVYDIFTKDQKREFERAYRATYNNFLVIGDEYYEYALQFFEGKIEYQTFLSKVVRAARITCSAGGLGPQCPYTAGVSVALMMAQVKILGEKGHSYLDVIHHCEAIAVGVLRLRLCSPLLDNIRTQHALEEVDPELIRNFLPDPVQVAKQLHGLFSGHSIGSPLSTALDFMPNRNVEVVRPWKMDPSGERRDVQGKEINGAGTNSGYAVYQRTYGRATASNPFPLTINSEQGILLGSVHRVTGHFFRRCTENGMDISLARDIIAMCITGTASRIVSTKVVFSCLSFKVKCYGVFLGSAITFLVSFHGQGLSAVSNIFTGDEKKEFEKAHVDSFSDFHVFWDKYHKGRFSHLMDKIGEASIFSVDELDLGSLCPYTVGVSLAFIRAQVEILKDKGHSDLEIFNSVNKTVDVLNNCIELAFGRVDPEPIPNNLSDLVHGATGTSAQLRNEEMSVPPNADSLSVHASADSNNTSFLQQKLGKIVPICNKFFPFGHGSLLCGFACAYLLARGVFGLHFNYSGQGFSLRGQQDRAIVHRGFSLNAWFGAQKNERFFIETLADCLAKFSNMIQKNS